MKRQSPASFFFLPFLAKVHVETWVLVLHLLHDYYTADRP